MRILRKEADDAIGAETRGKTIGKIGNRIAFNRMAIETGLQGIERIGMGDGKAYQVKTEARIDRISDDNVKDVTSSG